MHNIIQDILNTIIPPMENEESGVVIEMHETHPDYFKPINQGNCNDKDFTE